MSLIRTLHTFSHLGVNFKGTKITGVGFDRDVLLRAGIEHCDALAAVTSNDEANILIARIARLLFQCPPGCLRRS